MIFLVTLLTVTSSFLVAEEVGSNEKSTPSTATSVDLDKEPLASIIKFYATSQKPAAFKVNANPRIRQATAPLVQKTLATVLKSPIAIAERPQQIIGLAPVISYPTFKKLSTKSTDKNNLFNSEKEREDSIQPPPVEHTKITKKRKNKKKAKSISTTTSYPSSNYEFIVPIIHYDPKKPKGFKKNSKSEVTEKIKGKDSATQNTILALPSIAALPFSRHFKTGSKIDTKLLSPPNEKYDSNEHPIFVLNAINRKPKLKRSNSTEEESIQSDSRTKNSTSPYKKGKHRGSSSLLDSEIYFKLPFITFDVNNAEYKDNQKQKYNSYIIPRSLPLKHKKTVTDNPEFVEWGISMKYDTPSQLKAPDVSKESIENPSKEKSSSEVSSSQFEYSAKHSLPFRTKVLKPKPFQIGLLEVPGYGEYEESEINSEQETILKDKDDEIVKKEESKESEESNKTDKKKEKNYSEKAPKNTFVIITQSPSVIHLKDNYKYDDSEKNDSKENKNKKYKWVNGKIVPKCRRFSHSPYPNVVIKNLPHNILKDHQNSEESKERQVYYRHSDNRKRKRPNKSEKVTSFYEKNQEPSTKSLYSDHPLKKSNEENKKTSKEILDKIRSDLEGEHKPILEDAEVLFPSDLKPKNDTSNREKESASKENKSDEKRKERKSNNSNKEQKSNESRKQDESEDKSSEKKKLRSSESVRKPELDENKSKRNENESNESKTKTVERKSESKENEKEEKIKDHERKEKSEENEKGEKKDSREEKRKADEKSTESEKTEKVSKESGQVEKERNQSNKEESEEKAKTKEETEPNQNKKEGDVKSKEDGSKEENSDVKKDEKTSKENPPKSEEELKKEEEAKIAEQLKREEEAKREAEEQEERQWQIEKEILEDFKSVFPDISSGDEFDDIEEYYGGPNRKQKRREDDSNEKEASNEDKKQKQEENLDYEEDDNSAIQLDNIEQEILEDLQRSHPIYVFSGDDDEYQKPKKKYGSINRRFSSKPAKLSQQESSENDSDEFFKGWHHAERK